MLYSMDSEGKRCFHPDIVDFMQDGRHDKLSSILRSVDVKNAVDHTGSTLLHLSAEFGTRYLSTFFLKVARIDANAANDRGSTPLMLAARNANLEQVALLLESGADVRAKDVNGTSALMIAERYRNVEPLVALFVDHVVQICDNDDRKIAELLLSAGCRVPYRFDAFANAEISRRMLELDASQVNARDKQRNGNAPLHAAVENNDLAAVRVLLRFGADRLLKNRSDSIAFEHAFARRERVDFAMLELLLPASAEGDRVDWTERKARSEKMRLHPIFVSADRRTLELFLRRCAGLDLKAKDGHGRTAVHYLVENENEGVWDLLAESAMDLDVDARDRAGSTALHLAAALVNCEAVQFLLDRGADANALNDVARTPLLNVFTNRGILNCRAANYHECIELLLHRGADVQLIDANKESLIAHATYLRPYDLHVPIVAHLALLESIGEPINHLVKSAIAMDRQFRALYESCRRQLDDTRGSKLCGELTYFRLLSEECATIASRAQIDDILRGLSRENSYADSYYARLLRRRLLTAKRTMSWKEQRRECDVTIETDIDGSSSAHRFDCRDLDSRFARCCALEKTAGE